MLQNYEHNKICRPSFDFVFPSSPFAVVTLSWTSHRKCVAQTVTDSDSSEKFRRSTRRISKALRVRQTQASEKPCACGAKFEVGGRDVR